MRTCLRTHAHINDTGAWITCNNQYGAKGTKIQFDMQSMQMTRSTELGGTCGASRCCHAANMREIARSQGRGIKVTCGPEGGRHLQGHLLIS